MYVLDTIKTKSATEGETSRGELSTSGPMFHHWLQHNNGKGATRKMVEYTLRQYVPT